MWRVKMCLKPWHLFQIQNFIPSISAVTGIAPQRYVWRICIALNCAEFCSILFQIQNTIPSISAVTGIAPQRYVWRICIALHCTPRFIIAFIYWNYYMRKIHLVAEKHHKLFKRLMRLNFWLYTIENSCLVGVSYISNVENYREYCCLTLVLINSLRPSDAYMRQ